MRKKKKKGRFTDDDIRTTYWPYILKHTIPPGKFSRIIYIHHTVPSYHTTYRVFSIYRTTNIPYHIPCFFHIISYHQHTISHTVFFSFSISNRTITTVYKTVPSYHTNIPGTQEEHDASARRATMAERQVHKGIYLQGYTAVPTPQEHTMYRYHTAAPNTTTTREHAIAR